MICQTTGIVFFTILGLASSQNSFRSFTDCVCPQDVVTYECTVCGLATAWEGTALGSCSGGEIALTNRDFMAPIQTIVCSGGRIAARGIIVEDGCFTSQLNITFNATALQGRSVRCSVDNGTHAAEVGRDMLTLTIDPYLPPANVQLVGVSPNMELLFSWNQTQNCPSLRYNINQSENCGQCPNTTTDTSVNCSDFTLSNSINLCTFAVQAVICGNNGTSLFGNFSDFITVNLTVPPINQVTTIPHYHTDNGLRSLTVLFLEVDPFLIYEGINGTVNSYMIYYSDSDTGELCGSNEIHCDERDCSTEFDISSVSSCRPSSDINVTISAVTNLGEGPSTAPIMEEHQNNFVRVQVISESASINCAFLNASKETAKSCGATITYGDNCEEQIQINGVRDSDKDSLIRISLTSVLENYAIMTICGFRINAMADTRTVTVDGNLVAIPINNQIPSNGSAIIAAALVPIVVMLLLIVGIFFMIIILYFKIHQTSRNNYFPDIPLQSVKSNTKLKIITVSKECNMIDFAKENFNNYDPDSGNGYYQFIKSAEEYIPSKTQVLLVSKDEGRVSSDLEARKMIGISDKRKKVKLPDLSNSEWKYAFIQSTSRIRMLPEGSLFMYYKFCDDPETERARTPLKQKETEENLKRVEDKYIKLKKVPGDQEYPVLEFAKTMAPHYNPGLGYGFYEFTKPEFITYDKQVILMDKNERLYHGSDARRIIGIGPGYDEAEERRPNFDTRRWKCAFVQTRSNVRKLQPNTWFLYCDVASSEMITVLEPYKLFTVTEDGQKLINFAKHEVAYYNPRAGYGYYEFTEPGYVLPKRNIMALNKKTRELFTGPGVRQLIGAAEDYDGTKEISPPDLSETEWECIFIQGKKAYGRLLPKNTRFLYCEYDYRPEDY